MSDIKMSKFFDLPYQPTTETVNREIVNTWIDLNGKPADAAVHAINSHDDLVKRVAELEGALEAIIINQKIMAGDSSLMLDKLTCYQIANNALNPISTNNNG